VELLAVLCTAETKLHSLIWLLLPCQSLLDTDGEAVLGLTEGFRALYNAIAALVSAVSARCDWLTIYRTACLQ